MRKSESDDISKFALVVTVIGISGFIVLSSGIFSKQTSDSNTKFGSGLNPELKIKDWRRELDHIAKQSSEKQKELEDLTSRLARIRLEVQKRNADLGQLINKQSNRFVEASMLLKNFGHLTDLKDFLLMSKDETFIFSTHTGPDGISYQNVSMGRPFAENSIFLRRPGIKWAQAVSKAAIDLQARSIIVRYDSTEGELPMKKAQVLQRYVQELLYKLSSGSTRIVVEFERAMGRLTSTSGVDLFMTFDSGAMQGER